MTDLVVTVLTNAIVSGLLLFVLQQYTLHYVKRRLEPLVAEDILSRQNLVNSKLRIYQAACELVCRSLASRTWSGPDVPPDRRTEGTVPGEVEVNSCAASLALFTGDIRIRAAFMKCFTTASPVDLGHFVGLLREDLGYGAGVVDPEKYLYVFSRGGAGGVA